MSSQPLCFVDSVGGGLAALGAAVARALGHSDAIAATSGAEVALPKEIAIVLEEVGMSVPAVAKLDEEAPRKRVVVFLGDDLPSELASQARALPLRLFDGEGELERLATARIARDLIERRLEALIQPAG